MIKSILVSKVVSIVLSKVKKVLFPDAADAMAEELEDLKYRVSKLERSEAKKKNRLLS